MARFTVADRCAIGSTILPIISLYAPAASGGRIREIGVFNTTAVAVELAVKRFTATGTQGAALTENEYDPDGPPPLMTGFATHTVTPTIVSGDGLRVGVLGAAIGAGIIWTFGDSGLVIQPGTGNGVGILVANGTGQICQAYIEWDE